MKLLEQLNDALTHASPRPALEGVIAARALCDAVDSERYGFGLEPFHGLTSSPHEVLPHEFLLRPSAEDGSHVDLRPGLNVLREMNMIARLDTVVIPRAIEKAFSLGEQGLPVSVNVATESLEDENFRTFLFTYLQNLLTDGHKAGAVVLEMPVCGSTSLRAIRWVKEVKDLGFRIAFDNFGSSTLNLDALHLVEPQFVKIDGSIILEALSGKAGLGPIVKKVRELSPNSRLLAPWVTSVRDAQRLHAVYGIDAVQGRTLTKDRGYFKSQWDFLLYAE